MDQENRNYRPRRAVWVGSFNHGKCDCCGGICRLGTDTSPLCPRCAEYVARIKRVTSLPVWQGLLAIATLSLLSLAAGIAIGLTLGGL